MERMQCPGGQVSTLVHANISLKLNRGWGTLLHSEPNLCVCNRMNSAGYPDLSLEPVKLCLGPEEIVYTPVQSCESVTVSEKYRERIS